MLKSRLYREGRRDEVYIEINQEQLLERLEKTLGEKEPKMKRTKLKVILKIVSIASGLMALALVGLMSYYLYNPLNTTMLFIVAFVAFGLSIVSEILRIISELPKDKSLGFLVQRKLL